MKKTVAVILMITLLLVGASALASYSVKAVASPTYVRNGPGLSYRIIDKLTAGNYYEYANGLEYDNRGIAWYSVYYFGGYGWVSSLHANLVDNSTGGAYDNGRSGAYSNATSVYASSDVNVRSGPGANYRSIGTMYRGWSADYTGFSQKDSKGTKWYQISWYGQTGWVSSKYTYIR